MENVGKQSVARPDEVNPQAQDITRQGAKGNEEWGLGESQQQQGGLGEQNQSALSGGGAEPSGIVGGPQDKMPAGEISGSPRGGMQQGQGQFAAEEGQGKGEGQFAAEEGQGKGEGQFADKGLSGQAPEGQSGAFNQELSRPGSQFTQKNEGMFGEGNRAAKDVSGGASGEQGGLSGLGQGQEMDREDINKQTAQGPQAAREEPEERNREEWGEREERGQRRREELEEGRTERKRR